MDNFVGFSYNTVNPQSFKLYRYCGEINLVLFSKLLEEGKTPEVALSQARHDFEVVDVEDEQDRWAFRGR